MQSTASGNSRFSAIIITLLLRDCAFVGPLSSLLAKLMCAFQSRKTSLFSSIKEDFALLLTPPSYLLTFHLETGYFFLV
jgi:hypothetical protein